jgi:hypothetical protein
MRLMYFDNRRASPILEWFQQDWTTGTLTGINDPSGGIPAFQPPASLQAGSIVASHAANGDVVLNWTTGATLQVANQVTGPYVDIPGSVSPYVQIPAVGSKFYRLRF